MKKSVAVVVPCYNEQDGLAHFVDALIKERTKLTKQYELDIVLINDGSKDRTQDVIELLSDNHNFIFYRTFAKNLGHQSALRAGIDACTGYNAVLMMDADMQHPPKLIGQMLDAWEEGVRIVQMTRRDSAKEAGGLKYATAKLYYKLLNNLSSLNMEYGASDFRLIDKSVAKLVADSKERNLFLRGYFSWIPVSRVTIPYKPAPRFAGKSTYTFKKMLDLASKGILQFSEKPLMVAMNVGILMAIISFIYGVVLIIGHFAGRYAVSGWTSLMVVLLFCFGINFILLGIIGRYLAHGLQLLKSRPEYVIKAEKLRSWKAW